MFKFMYMYLAHDSNAWRQAVLQHCSKQSFVAFLFFGGVFFGGGCYNEWNHHVSQSLLTWFFFPDMLRDKCRDFSDFSYIHHIKI